MTRLIPPSADRPGDDPIFALHAEAVRRAAEGADVLDATLGALMEDDGRLCVMPSVFESYRRVAPEAGAAYAPISGPTAFLDSVLDDLLDGSPLRASAIAAATPGGTGACHHAIVNFLEPGQELLTTSWFWGPYGILAEHTRRGLRTFDMFAPEGGLNLASFEQELTRLVADQGRALVILNTPCHNPTGYSLDEKDWDGVVDIVGRASEQAPVALVLDHAYAKFAAPGPLLWRDSFERLAGKASLLVAWTASKAFAQYGARVGACIAIEPDEDERARIRNALGYSCRGTWSNCNHLGMLAIAGLLTDDELRERSEADRARLRDLLSARVESFNALARDAGLSYPRYEGGFFVSIFTPDPERTCATARERGVYLVPLRGAVRVAICATPASDIPRLVEAVAEGVRAAEGTR